MTEVVAATLTGSRFMPESTDFRQRVRDLRTQAERARRLAREVTLDADRERLETYAAELEQEATELMRRVGPLQAAPPSPVPQVQQQQQQQQQQQAVDPADPADEEPEKPEQ